jgi:hypothetical protein
VPQAWAAAVPLLAAQLFLGLVPDAPRNRCYVMPSLPPWLPRLALRGIALGDKTLAIAVVRSGDETVIESIDAPGIDVIRDEVEAPLWGLPPVF